MSGTLDTRLMPASFRPARICRAPSRVPISIFLVEDSRYQCQAAMNGAKSPRVKPISFHANGISTARISGRPRQGPGRKTFRGKVSGFFFSRPVSAVLMVLRLLFLFTFFIPVFKRKRQKLAREIGG